VRIPNFRPIFISRLCINVFVHVGEGTINRMRRDSARCKPRRVNWRPRPDRPDHSAAVHVGKIHTKEILAGRAVTRRQDCPALPDRRSRCFAGTGSSARKAAIDVLQDRQGISAWLPCEPPLAGCEVLSDRARGSLSLVVVVLTFGPTPFNTYVLTFEKAGGVQSSDESRPCAGKSTVRCAAQNADHSLRLLRPCCCGRRGGSTKKRNEIATPHWRSPCLLSTQSCALETQCYQYRPSVQNFTEPDRFEVSYFYGGNGTSKFELLGIGFIKFDFISTRDTCRVSCSNDIEPKH
jgi:hypothetical protein